MPPDSSTHRIYLEVGKRKTFAVAVDWPGWARWGKDEEGAAQALLEAGPRYTSILERADLEFEASNDASGLRIVERLEGNATTDFGAPAIAPAGDADPVSEEDLGRFRMVLEACWAGFDAAVRKAEGKGLRVGPRGGGRDLEKMVEHVRAAEHAYLARIGWKIDKGADLAQTREGILAGLDASARGELPAEGPRGGKRWPPRYFARRVAWHVLDHAWEIEDRIE